MNAGEPGSESIATDSEIERQRARWETDRRKKHLEFLKQLPPFHTSSTFMDYLHGDVKEAEQWWACHYEYARESKGMREAARDRDALQHANPLVSCERIVLTVAGRHPGNWWAGMFRSLKFLMCNSFPGKDWNELSEAERNAVMDGPPRKDAPPLPMPDMWTLTGMLKAPPWTDRLRLLMEESTPVIENVPPGGKGHPIKLVWPLLQAWHSHYWAVFDVDFSKSETQLVNEFKEWLKQPENEKRLQDFKEPKAGMTGQPLDRLKDLAAWRLYRELSNDWNAANDFANQNRKHFTAREIREKYRTKEQRNRFRSGNPKPFRDAKTKGKQQPNEADLFGEEADARKAKANAWEFLTEIMPQEFPSLGPATLDVFVELKKRASKA